MNHLIIIIIVLFLSALISGQKKDGMWYEVYSNLDQVPILTSGGFELILDVHLDFAQQPQQQQREQEQLNGHLRKKIKISDDSYVANAVAVDAKKPVSSSCESSDDDDNQQFHSQSRPIEGNPLLSKSTPQSTHPKPSHSDNKSLIHDWQILHVSNELFMRRQTVKVSLLCCNPRGPVNLSKVLPKVLSRFSRIYLLRLTISNMYNLDDSEWKSLITTSAHSAAGKPVNSSNSQQQAVPSSSQDVPIKDFSIEQHSFLHDDHVFESEIGHSSILCNRSLQNTSARTINHLVISGHGYCPVLVMLTLFKFCKISKDDVRKLAILTEPNKNDSMKSLSVGSMNDELMALFSRLPFLYSLRIGCRLDSRSCSNSASSAASDDFCTYVKSSTSSAFTASSSTGPFASSAFSVIGFWKNFLARVDRKILPMLTDLNLSLQTSTHSKDSLIMDSAKALFECIPESISSQLTSISIPLQLQGLDGLSLVKVLCRFNRLQQLTFRLSGIIDENNSEIAALAMVAACMKKRMLKSHFNITLAIDAAMIDVEDAFVMVDKLNKLIHGQSSYSTVNSIASNCASSGASNGTSTVRSAIGSGASSDAAVRSASCSASCFASSDVPLHYCTSNDTQLLPILTDIHDGLINTLHLSNISSSPQDIAQLFWMLGNKYSGVLSTVQLSYSINCKSKSSWNIACLHDSIYLRVITKGNMPSIPSRFCSVGDGIELPLRLPIGTNSILDVIALHPWMPPYHPISTAHPSQSHNNSSRVQSNATTPQPIQLTAQQGTLPIISPLLLNDTAPVEPTLPSNSSSHPYRLLHHQWRLLFRKANRHVIYQIFLLPLARLFFSSIRVYIDFCTINEATQHDIILPSTMHMEQGSRDGRCLVLKIHLHNTKASNYTQYQQQQQEGENVSSADWLLLPAVSADLLQFIRQKQTESAEAKKQYNWDFIQVFISYSRLHQLSHPAIKPTLELLGIGRMDRIGYCEFTITCNFEPGREGSPQQDESNSYRHDGTVLARNNHGTVNARNNHGTVHADDASHNDTTHADSASRSTNIHANSANRSTNVYARHSLNEDALMEEESFHAREAILHAEVLSHSQQGMRNDTFHSTNHPSAASVDWPSALKGSPSFNPFILTGIKQELLLKLPTNVHHSRLQLFGETCANLMDSFGPTRLFLECKMSESLGQLSRYRICDQSYGIMLMLECITRCLKKRNTGCNKRCKDGFQSKCNRRCNTGCKDGPSTGCKASEVNQYSKDTSLPEIILVMPREICAEQTADVLYLRNMQRCLERMYWFSKHNPLDGNICNWPIVGLILREHFAPLGMAADMNDGGVGLPGNAYEMVNLENMPINRLIHRKKHLTTIISLLTQQTNKASETEVHGIHSSAQTANRMSDSELQCMSSNQETSKTPSADGQLMSSYRETSKKTSDSIGQSMLSSTANVFSSMRMAIWQKIFTEYLNCLPRTHFPLFSSSSALDDQSDDAEVSSTVMTVWLQRLYRWSSCYSMFPNMSNMIDDARMEGLLDVLNSCNPLCQSDESTSASLVNRLQIPSLLSNNPALVVICLQQLLQYQLLLNGITRILDCLGIDRDSQWSAHHSDIAAAMADFLNTWCLDNQLLNALVMSTVQLNQASAAAIIEQLKQESISISNEYSALIGSIDDLMARTKPQSFIANGDGDLAQHALNRIRHLTDDLTQRLFSCNDPQEDQSQQDSEKHQSSKVNRYSSSKEYFNVLSSIKSFEIQPHRLSAMLASSVPMVIPHASLCLLGSLFVLSSERNDQHATARKFDCPLKAALHLSLLRLLALFKMSSQKILFIQQRINEALSIGSGLTSGPLH